MTPQPCYKDRLKLFHNLVKRLAGSSYRVSSQSDFIGWGNPFANILIVGCEMNLDATDPSVKRALTGNVSAWASHFERNELTPFWEECFNHCSGKGVAPTWKAYQRLIDMTKGITRQNKNLDFYNSCFVTEMSSQPSPNIKGYFQLDLHKGISRRINSVLNDDFFRDFKVVVLACGYYANYYNITQCFGELTEMSRRKDANFKNDDLKTNTKSSANYFYKLNTNKQLIILTRQLSNGYSNNLLECIANEIKLYINNSILNKLTI